MHQERHLQEAEASFRRYQEMAAAVDDVPPYPERRARMLHHHHHHHHRLHEPENTETSSAAVVTLEAEKEAQFWEKYRHDHDHDEEIRSHDRRKRGKRLQALWSNPGIGDRTVHGIMIDAGSTGSRLHVYEWEPRVLRNEREIALAVSGEQLSFPGTESRWTERLRPGLATFATTTADDAELLQAVAEYLQPLLDFATSVLHTKQDRFSEFPIFLRATAGMRMLDPLSRARVMNAVRTLLHNVTYSPFAFVDEQARVLSGEEEATYDWVGVNFLLGELLQQSAGAGTVSNPRLTHGALDMGGASTQISFYEPNEDIMSNLFKLQIGQAKHWNIYAHSFLFYGINEAIDRFHARLAANKTTEERLLSGVYNPCLPRGSRQDVRTNIHLETSGVETWTFEEGLYLSGDGYFQAVLVNENKHADVDQCLAMAKDLLHLEKNDWCDFAHKGDCSLGGIYQPALPVQGTDSFGEFVAFSNYFHIWQFLHLPERATMAELEVATHRACSLTLDELVAFNDGRIDEGELESYCFRSAYAFVLLHNGYGFQLNDTIRVTELIEGQKVGWALGAMLYEINTMPWHYETKQEEISHGFHPHYVHLPWETAFLLMTIFGLIGTLLLVFVRRERNLRRMYTYEPIKDVSMQY